MRDAMNAPLRVIATEDGQSGMTQARLVQSLTDPGIYGPWCTAVRVIETHISYVPLTGRYAYKIKKDVNLGFLDFTTLAARRLYCERELALNRRSAPAISLEVVAVTGTVDHPPLGDDGAILEYAVKMVEFPQDALLTSMLARGALTEAHIAALADCVAAFHLGAATAPMLSPFGSPDAILALANENFTELEPLLDDRDRQVASRLRLWAVQEHGRLADIFAARRRGGFVRELACTPCMSALLPAAPRGLNRHRRQRRMDLFESSLVGTPMKVPAGRQ
jgi:uncharacterized protein